MQDTRARRARVRGALDGIIAPEGWGRMPVPENRCRAGSELAPQDSRTLWITLGRKSGGKFAPAQSFMKQTGKLRDGAASRSSFTAGYG